MLGTGFITSIIIARTLKTNGLGIYTIVTLVPSIAASIISLGFDTANTYLVGKNKYTTTEVISNALSISLILIIVGLVIALLLATRFGLVPEDVKRMYIYIAMLIIPFDVLNRLMSGVVYGLNKIRRINTIRFTANLCFVVLLVIFLNILNFGTAGAIIAGIIAMIINASLIFLELPEKRNIHPKLNMQWLKDAFLYGIRERAGAILDVLIARADVFLIAYFIGLSQLGVYAVSYKIFMMLVQIPMAIFYVLFAKVSVSNYKDANKTVPVVCRNTIFIVLTLTAIAFAAAKPFIIIFYGNEYEGSVYPTMILLPGAVFLSIVYIMQAYFNGMGKPHYYIYLSSSMLFINICLNLILIPSLGINGAAIATISAYFIGMFLSLLLYLNLSNNILKETLFITKNDVRRYFDIYKNFKIKLGISKPQINIR